MATYCISDIHGHKTAFDEMLDLIKFGTDDVLYILGDIIDKGEESAEMLLWAINDAPDNVHFLMGNHEDMAASVILRNPNTPFISSSDPWGWNGGVKTLNDICEQASEEWIKGPLCEWLRNLPMYYKVEVNNRKFLLVHAGTNPDAYKGNGIGYSGDHNDSQFARHKIEDIGWGFGKQHDQALLWERYYWILDKESAPTDVVFGHTFIRDEIIEHAEQLGHETTGGNGKIFHIQNKHGIDCGCAYETSYREYGDKPENVSCNLACLRLDDMKEFYVPFTEHEKKK